MTRARRPPGLGAVGRRDSVADETRRYIESRPSIRDCIRYNIINFTALARRIRAETGVGSQEAIEIACRRYRRQLQEEPSGEELLHALLRSSHLQLRTHVAVVTVHADMDFMERLVVGAERLMARHGALVQLFQGSGYVTVLCDDRVLSAILSAIPRTSVVFLERRLSALSVQSPKEVLGTPRFLGYIADALGRAGINCIEMMSVHTETLFVVRPQDAVRAFETLDGLARNVEGTLPSPPNEAASLDGRPSGA